MRHTVQKHIFNLILTTIILEDLETPELILIVSSILAKTNKEPAQIKEINDQTEVLPFSKHLTCVSNLPSFPIAVI